MIVMLTQCSSRRHPCPEAKGHRDLRLGPEPTKPPGRRRPRRYLQHLATIQRPGPLRRPTLHRRLLYNGLGYRKVGLSLHTSYRNELYKHAR